MDLAIGQWWTAFIEGDGAAREALLSQGGKERAPRKRRRRGGGKSRKVAGNDTPADVGDAAGGNGDAATTHDVRED